MNVFKSVGDTIVNLLKRNKHADPVDKNDILNLIDNNHVLLTTVVDTYETNPELFAFIRSTLVPASGSNKDNGVAAGLYNDYIRTLSPIGRQQEVTGILRSVYMTAKFALADHQKIRDEFQSLFNDGTDVGDIKLEQMKLSHATLFGFINLSNLLADWFCFFIGELVGQSGEHNLRVPAYREALLRSAGPTVADFVNDVLARGANRGIVTVVQDIRKKGDVALYTDSATLDTYANINDYPGVSRFMNVFNPMQLILFARESLTRLANYFYKRNLMMRDWLLAKVAVLRMDMQKMDPNSPEYKRQQEIVQRYSDKLAQLDQKINTYEKS